MEKKNYSVPAVPEMEEVVLGAAMLEKTAMPILTSILRPEMFYVKTHEEIFKAIVGLHDRNQNIDILTVTEELKRRGQLDAVGGPYEIARLSGKVASAAHLEHHSLVVKEYFIRRELILGFNKLYSMSMDLTQDIADIITEGNSFLRLIEEGCSWKQNMRDMEQLMQDTMEEACLRVKNQKNGITGIPTGLNDLDKKTAGWQPGDLIVLAARPSMGKSALANFFVLNAARAAKHVLMYSLEMPGTQLGGRWILGESNLNPHVWKSGVMNESDLAAAFTASENLKPLPIYVDDTAYISMDEIRAGARNMHAKGKCDMVVIDYLQLAKCETNKNRNREQEVAEVSRRAKALAKELNCPVILLSQLNRELETRPSKIPKLSDLRESGSIEQDADMVILLYRPATVGIATDKETGYPTEGLGVGIIAKHRNGETGNVYFRHDASMTHISSFLLP